MKQYKEWRKSLSESANMLVGLAVNGVSAACLYILYSMVFEDGKINLTRVVFAGLFFSLLMTRSLKWRNIKALFRGDTGHV